MALLARVRRLLTDDGTVYECRHCGATLEADSEECPHCERGEAVAYDLE